MTIVGALDTQNHPVLFFPDITEDSPPFTVLDSLLEYFLQLYSFIFNDFLVAFAGMFLRSTVVDVGGFL